MEKYYAGIGSRKTPQHILSIMHQIAETLGRQGWTLRSGGADGADKAFESGAQAVQAPCEIYRPEHCTKESMEIACKFHPAWDRLSPYVKSLHGRNTMQIVGEINGNVDLTKLSKFVICWTPDGVILHKNRTIQTGGTGTAISIADSFGVPVYNLARTEHLDRLKNFITCCGA